MRQHIQAILIILTGLTLIACNNTTTDNKDLIISPDSTRITSSTDNDPTIDEIQEQSDKEQTKIIIKNRAGYSEKFIQGLKELGYKKIELIDSLLIIDNKDTITFPLTPEIGEQKTYTGRQDNLAIALIVKRINYTTVDYKIEMVEFGKANHNQSGQADIMPGFFFGAESNEYELTGEGYFVTEYIDNRNNECYTNIRLGDENELAKIIKNCNGKIKDITLDNFTTLHGK